MIAEKPTMYYHTLIVDQSSLQNGFILQLTSCMHQRIALRPTLKYLPRNLPNILEPTHIHQNVEIRQQATHDMHHARLAHDSETPDPQAANKDELRAEGERFDDIRCRANARVEHNIHLVADSCSKNISKEKVRGCLKTTYHQQSSLAHQDWPLRHRPVDQHDY
jgi:hypothetical protein